MIYALDIETKADRDEDAVNPWRNTISCIGIVGDDGYSNVFRDMAAFGQFVSGLKNGDALVTHGGKFDFKTLIVKGFGLSPEMYVEDTLMQAVACTHKIPEHWLEGYEIARRKLNETLGGKRDVHRRAGRHSLKTLAPYFLGVDPFWETANHDDDEYVLKDARYTLALWHKFNKMLHAEETYSFYKEKLMPWARMIMESELKGVRIDNVLLEKKAVEHEALAEVSSKKLHEMWRDAYVEWHSGLVRELQTKYAGMTQAALQRLKNPTEEKINNTKRRYDEMRNKAISQLPDKMNLSSPAQLMWILRDYYKLDVTNFQEDETTGKSVLNRLAEEGRKDVAELLEYRKHSKLVSAFFPSYREMQVSGRIHASFNLQGTRTGRLSSSEPNLQQVPGHLHPLFVPSDGHKLLCYDLAGIEPVVIAYLTEDPILCDILINGGNFHNHNVRVFFGVDAPDSVIKTEYKKERELAKEVGLSLLYGAGPNRLQESSQRRGLPLTYRDCRDIYERFKEEYKQVFDFKKQLDASLMIGENMVNVMGRKLSIPDERDVHMKGFNTLVQSSASDMLLHAAYTFTKRAKEQGINALPLLYVHDEVVIEAKASQAEDAKKLLLSCFGEYKLETRYGNVPVVAEGGISDAWVK